MASIELALYRADDRPVLTVGVNVLPGQEVRPDEAVIFQPALVFRGRSNDRADPRRMLLFHDARDVRLARTAFDLRHVTERKQLTVSYLTPTRRYTYQRVKEGQED